MLAHPAAAVDLVLVDPPRSLRGILIGAPHLLDRPREVHRGRARGEQHVRGLGEILTTRIRERVRVCRCDADRRSATDGHDADGLGDLARRAALELDLLVGKPTLVEDDDAVAFESDDLLGLEVPGDRLDV